MDRLLPCGRCGVDEYRGHDDAGVGSPNENDDGDKFVNSDDDDVGNQPAASGTGGAADKLTIRQRLLACTGGGDNSATNNNNEDGSYNDDNNNNSDNDEATDVAALSSESTINTFARKLQTLVMTDHYTILRKIGTGTFGSVLLCVRHRDQTKMALKKLPMATTRIDDFRREFLFSFRLSSHQAVVKTFDVAFKTRTSFVFAQEYASRGDLLRSVTPRRGLGETQVKTVARQIGSALEYMHGRALVHRDVKPENILVFDDRLFRVKLADFGVARKVGTLVCKMCQGTAYTPPEICAQPKGRGYRVETSADVWAFGVVLFCIMTGSFPWNIADSGTDVLFHEFMMWQTRKTSTPPIHWARFSPDLLRLFRRMLECEPKRRTAIGTLFNYTDVPWLATSSGPAPVQTQTVVERRPIRRHTPAGGNEGCVTPRVGHGGERRRSENPQCRSAHFSTLQRCAIESAADRKSRVDRVNDWLLNQITASLSAS